MVHYLFPSVGTEIKLERHCPHCHRVGAWIHSSRHERAISDVRAETVPQQRQYCPFCGTTWTVRAHGVGAGRTRSERLRAMGVFLYMLVEWLLDYVFKIDFRTKWSRHIPYIVLEYVALGG